MTYACAARTAPDRLLIAFSPHRMFRQLIFLTCSPLGKINGAVKLQEDIYTNSRGNVLWRDYITPDPLKLIILFDWPIFSRRVELCLFVFGTIPDRIPAISKSFCGSSRYFLEQVTSSRCATSFHYLTQALLLLKCSYVNENGCRLLTVVHSYCLVVKEVLTVYVLRVIFVLR